MLYRMKNGPYLMVVAPDGYPGKKYRGKYAYVHHIEIWRATKNVIAPGMVVHHINGDKHDNSVSNLEILHVSEHRKLHSRPVSYVNFVCSWCKRKVLRQKKQFKSNYKNHYCNRSCMGSHQTRIIQGTMKAVG